MDMIKYIRRKYEVGKIEEPTEESPNIVLHERLEERELTRLYQVFQKIPEGKATAEQLRKIMSEYANCNFTDEQFETLFLKINSNRDGHATWDEFVSYLLLGFQNDDLSNQKETMQQPITGHPTVLWSQHRLPVIRIQYCPTVMPDRTTSFLEGSYITCSRDGTCNWWTLDMEKHRSAKSRNIEPRIHPTWILDMVCLPDLNILCTSSSEGDLRFYDTTARNFTVRIVITSLPVPVSAMYYRFYKSLDSENTLVTGDMSGTVRVLLFSPTMRGPFQNSPGKTLQIVRYDTLARGEFPRMRVLEFPNTHAEAIRYVGLYEPLHCFISCCELPAGPLGPPGLSISDMMGVKPPYQFRMPRGASVFTYDDTAHVLVTGGLDCIIRLWNVFVPSKPNVLLSGHHAGIIMLILQNEKLYSMSKDKVIKVWDIPAQVIMQTYITLSADLGSDHCALTTLYNPVTRELMVAGMKIAILQLDPLLDESVTDGYTHNKPVSVVLYNKLFKYIVTCGLDSCIITWDPWIGALFGGVLMGASELSAGRAMVCGNTPVGKRICLVKGAHTTVVHGETIDVEITSATFDPVGQMLLTGARNGTLKVWNFNTGICLRNMSIENMCEVTAVFWIQARLLAIGWNRHVTEFADEVAAAGSKEWELRHAEDVLCAATRTGQALASSSYSGELIFWRLETGQAYRRFNVANPTGRIKLVYMPPEIAAAKQAPKPQTMPVPEAVAPKREAPAQISRLERAKTANIALAKQPLRRASRKSSAVQVEEKQGAKLPSVKVRSMSIYKRGSVIGHDVAPETMVGAKKDAGKGRFARKISVVKMPTTSAQLRTLSVHSMIFLESRPMSPDIGSMLLSIENGTIQLWSHHPAGGFKAFFNAIHTAGDYVSAMTTDTDNDYLFTGTTAGYLKIWLMTNYGYFNEELPPRPTSMPSLRLKFPFLWRDRLEGRAKRVVRQQPLPVLLSSHKSHLSTVLSVQYISENQIILTASSDHSVRLWTLGGRYISTLGTFKPWHPISEMGPIPENFPHRAPPDIKRNASFTTMKVLEGKDTVSRATTSDIDHKGKDHMTLLGRRRIYGKPLEDPILGHHFQLPRRGELRGKPILDTSLPYIPVYSHLDVHEPHDRPRPPTPEIIRSWKSRRSTATADLPNLLTEELDASDTNVEAMKD